MIHVVGVHLKLDNVSRFSLIRFCDARVSEARFYCVNWNASDFVVLHNGRQ